MRVKSNGYLRSFGALLTVILFSALAVAQETPEAQRQTLLQNVKIKNFGQMDERFYRGAQPKTEADYKLLAALGVKTVIDLQANPRDYERGFVEANGMRYVNIPMEAKTYPTEEQVQAFLKLVDDPSTGAFYLHCAGGRHRTGAMGAVYRFNKYGWNYEQVYSEMKKFDFYTSWGHGDYKKFVQDYWQKVQTNGHAAAPVTNVATTGQ
ncbi:MAG TPA: tyrosine-protein phosphatase [Pyrinomonadaceae bacterium]|nr:tyrosine-protein phosphatase [Pyrinomonadaceae bacterium]